MTNDDIDKKLDAIMERLIVLEQRVGQIFCVLKESKDDRKDLHKQLDEIKEVHLKTKTVLGASVFLVSSLFTFIVSFKDHIILFFKG